MFSRVTVGKEITAKKGEPDHMPKPHAVIVAGCIYGLPTPLSEKLDIMWYTQKNIPNGGLWSFIILHNLIWIVQNDPQVVD